MFQAIIIYFAMYPMVEKIAKHVILLYVNNSDSNPHWSTPEIILFFIPIIILFIVFYAFLFSLNFDPNILRWVVYDIFIICICNDALMRLINPIYFVCFIRFYLPLPLHRCVCDLEWLLSNTLRIV